MAIGDLQCLKDCQLPIPVVNCILSKLYGPLKDAQSTGLTCVYCSHWLRLAHTGSHWLTLAQTGSHWLTLPPELEFCPNSTLDHGLALCTSSLSPRRLHHKGLENRSNRLSFRSLLCINSIPWLFYKPLWTMVSTLAGEVKVRGYPWISVV